MPAMESGSGAPADVVVHTDWPKAPPWARWPRGSPQPGTRAWSASCALRPHVIQLSGHSAIITTCARSSGHPQLGLKCTGGCNCPSARATTLVGSGGPQPVRRADHHPVDPLEILDVANSTMTRPCLAPISTRTRVLRWSASSCSSSRTPGARSPGLDRRSPAAPTAGGPGAGSASATGSSGSGRRCRRTSSSSARTESPSASVSAASRSWSSRSGEPSSARACPALSRRPGRAAAPPAGAGAAAASSTPPPGSGRPAGRPPRGSARTPRSAAGRRRPRPAGSAPPAGCSRPAPARGSRRRRPPGPARGSSAGPPAGPPGNAARRRSARSRPPRSPAPAPAAARRRSGSSRPARRAPPRRSACRGWNWFGRTLASGTSRRLETGAFADLGRDQRAEAAPESATPWHRPTSFASSR